MHRPACQPAYRVEVYVGWVCLRRSWHAYTCTGLPQHAQPPTPWHAPRASPKGCAGPGRLKSRTCCPPPSTAVLHSMAWCEALAPLNPLKPGEQDCMLLPCLHPCTRALRSGRAQTVPFASRGRCRARTKQRLQAVRRTARVQPTPEDVRPALLGMPQGLHHQHARALAHHKAIAARVPGPGGPRRLVVALRQRPAGARAALSMLCGGDGQASP